MIRIWFRKKNWQMNTLMQLRSTLGINFWVRSEGYLVDVEDCVRESSLWEPFSLPPFQLMWSQRRRVLWQVKERTWNPCFKWGLYKSCQNQSPSSSWVKANTWIETFPYLRWKPLFYYLRDEKPLIKGVPEKGQRRCWYKLVCGEEETGVVWNWTA